MKDLFELMEEYEKKPMLRALIQLIPFGIGSAGDVYLTTKINNIRYERAKNFFSELDNGDIEISSDMLESEDFIHFYYQTVKAALNSRRKEKVKMFARLLRSSICHETFSTVDEYEEYLSILDELSYRELAVLFKLEAYEEQFPHKEDENDLQRANKFWDKFTQELINELLIPKDEIDAVLTRLNRTGCYETFVGGYFDYTGGKGKTTSTFKRLKQMVKEY